MRDAADPVTGETARTFETGNDQLFRELIPEFSADFVHLVMPDVARRIDLTALEFKRCEYFSDSPRGGRPRRPDLVGDAQVLGVPERKVTLHSEVEGKYRQARVPRLLDYNRLIATREGRPVHTVVVYVRGGRPGVARQVYREKSVGRTTTVFLYDSLGISRAVADEYLALPLPLAWALAALMKPGSLVNRTALRIACLRRICDARHLTESQRFKLFNFVASCIESDQGLSEEYDRLIQREEEVKKTMIDWAKKRRFEGFVEGREEGREVGLKEGLKEGLEEGLEKGRDELRSLVYSLVTQRFGEMPPKLGRWIAQIESLQELAQVAKRATVVKSPDDLLLRVREEAA